MKLGQAKSKTPIMLVLAPTRELAMQSAVVLEKVQFTCMRAFVWIAMCVNRLRHAFGRRA